MKKEHRHRFIIALIFLSLIFFFKRQCLNLPAFADELNYIHGVLIINKHHLNPFVEYWAYHPPVFFIIAASLCKIFGFSLFILRLPVLFYAFLMLYFTFLIGEKIYNERVGFLASLLLFFSPQFFSLSGLFYSDILVGALTLSSIYFFLENDILKYTISASLLVLTKEPAVLIVLSIATYKFLIGLHPLIKSAQPPLYKLKILAGESLLLSCPLLFFLAWMLINKITLGWYLWPNWTNLVLHSSINFYLYAYLLKQSYWIQFNFLVTVIIFASILFSLLLEKKDREQLLKKEIILFFIICLMNIAALGGLGELPGYSLTPRYFLLTKPLFYLIGAACLVHVIKNKILGNFIFGTIMLLFIYSWHTHDENWYDLNLGYMDVVRIHQQAIEFLKNHYPSNIIVANFPINEELKEPAYGYVQRRSKLVKRIDVLEKNSSTVINTNMPVKRLLPFLVITSKLFDGWTLEASQLDSYLETRNKKLLARFAAGDKEVVSIYSIN